MGICGGTGAQTCSPPARVANEPHSVKPALASRAFRAAPTAKQMISAAQPLIQSGRHCSTCSSAFSSLKRATTLAVRAVRTTGSLLSDAPALRVSCAPRVKALGGIMQTVPQPNISLPPSTMAASVMMTKRGGRSLHAAALARKVTRSSGPCEEEKRRVNLEEFDSQAPSFRCCG